MEDSNKVLFSILNERLELLRQLDAEGDSEKRRHIARETQNLHAPMAHRLGLYQIKTEMEDLALKFLDYDTYKYIAHALNAKKSERDEYIERFIAPLREKLEKEGFVFTIKGRPKSIHSIYHKMQAQHCDVDRIYDLFAILGIKTKKIDVKRDASNIYSQYMSIIKENNFEVLYPQIAKEWNYKKNKNIKPNMFSKASNKKVWWICNRGHEWQSSINKRTIGRGCPICSNKMLKKGENDIVSYCEQNDTLDVLQDWDYKKNNELGLIIDEMFPGTIEKVWWKCHICGYEWMSSVNNRIKKRHMCPSCRKSLAIGQNRKKVLNCETGVVYNSISEAARITNIKSSNISSVCTGKTKTAGGFHWKYCK